MGLNTFIKKYNLRSRKSLKTVESEAQNDPRQKNDSNNQSNSNNKSKSREEVRNEVPQKDQQNEQQLPVTLKETANVDKPTPQINKQNYQKKSLSKNSSFNEYDFSLKQAAAQNACTSSNSTRAKGFFKRNTVKLMQLSNMKKTNSRFSLANSERDLSQNPSASRSCSRSRHSSGSSRSIPNRSNSIRSTSSRNSTGTTPGGKLSVYNYEDEGGSVPGLQSSKSVMVIPYSEEFFDSPQKMRKIENNTQHQTGLATKERHWRAFFYYKSSNNLNSSTTKSSDHQKSMKDHQSGHSHHQSSKNKKIGSLSDIKKTSSVALTTSHGSSSKNNDIRFAYTGMNIKCGSGRSDGNLNIHNRDMDNVNIGITDTTSITNKNTNKHHGKIREKAQTLSPDLQHKNYYLSDVNFNNNHKQREKVISESSLHKLAQNNQNTISHQNAGQNGGRQGYPSSGYSSQVSSRHVSNNMPARGSRSKNTSSCSASSASSLKNKYQLSSHYSKPETDSINENSIHSQELIMPSSLSNNNNNSNEQNSAKFSNHKHRRRTKSIDVDYSDEDNYENSDSSSETDISTTSNPEDKDNGISDVKQIKHISKSVKQNPKAYQPKQNLRKVISDHPGAQDQFNTNNELITAESNQTLIASKSNLEDMKEPAPMPNQIKCLQEISRELNKLQQQQSFSVLGPPKSSLAAQISSQLSKPKFDLNAPEPLNNLKSSKSITQTDGVGAMMEEFKQKYEVTGIIGRGGGGTVYSGYRRSDKLSVAIKQVPKQKIKRWGTIYGFKVPIEFDLLNRVQQKHHSIIEMMDWYERRTSFVMVMERPPHSSDLFEYINRKGAISENNARFIMKQLIEVMIICFKESVFHRDIKDENIMINYHTYEVKLIDFGCGTNLKKSDYNEFAGTPEFYPPEWFNERKYLAEPQTVWSLGVLLWAILYGEVPFQDENAIKEYSGSIIHIKLQSTRVVLSEDALRFLQKALHYDEKRRPSLKYMLKSTWLRKMRKISAHCGEDVQSRLWSVMQNNRNPQFLEHLNSNNGVSFNWPCTSNIDGA